jgi:uncharacterized protein YbbK (DUF523 family)
MKLVSSCLMGLCTNWRGGASTRAALEKLLQSGEAVPFCPEQMGGLPTPRPPAEIQGGTGEDVLDGRARVMTQGGEDVTEHYLRGARETLKIAQAVAPELIVLKERSPSCGVRQIYDGTFSGITITGHGVTTALLLRNGFNVTSDEEYGL